MLSKIQPRLILLTLTGLAAFTMLGCAARPSARGTPWLDAPAEAVVVDYRGVEGISVGDENSLGVSVGQFFPANVGDLDPSVWFDVHYLRQAYRRFAVMGRVLIMTYEDEQDPQDDIDTTGVLVGARYYVEGNRGRLTFTAQIGQLLNDDSDTNRDTENSFAWLLSIGYDVAPPRMSLWAWKPGCSIPRPRKGPIRPVTSSSTASSSPGTCKSDFDG